MKKTPTMQRNKDTQLAALLASVAVVSGFALYWIIQIQAVREMLALAYGRAEVSDLTVVS